MLVIHILVQQPNILLDGECFDLSANEYASLGSRQWDQGSLLDILLRMAKLTEQKYFHSDRNHEFQIDVTWSFSRKLFQHFLSWQVFLDQCLGQQQWLQQCCLHKTRVSPQSVAVEAYLGAQAFHGLGSEMPD